MTSRKTLREQQLAAAAQVHKFADRLATERDPARARAARAHILADVDAAIEVIETLARVEA